MPFGDGFRCVGGPMFRLPFQTSSALGVMAAAVDFATGVGSAIDAGETWYFQCWHRDAAGPGGSGFNLSNGLQVEFCP